MARVIGPTPPGLGERKPATSATAGCTSPVSLPSTCETPTSSTAAPGLTMGGVIRCGTPAAATTTSARRTCAARSWVPVWHSVTVAFSVRRLRMRPIGRPTVVPRPMTTASAPSSRTPKRRSSTTQPHGVQGSGVGSPSTSLPRLSGCRPSASLACAIRSSTRNSSRPFGSGSCTRYAWQAGSSLSSRTAASTSAWAAVAGRRRSIESMPIRALSRCFIETYACEPGSSPTRIEPRPGVTPRSLSRVTRAARSARISFAAAQPSSTVAVIFSVSVPASRSAERVSVRTRRRALRSIGDQLNSSDIQHRE